MWVAGAILSDKDDRGHGYKAIEDVWNKVELGTEYISSRIIEDKNNADFFERVYPDNLKGTLHKTKDQVVEAYNSSFKS